MHFFIFQVKILLLFRKKRNRLQKLIIYIYCLRTSQFIACLSDQIPNFEFKNPEFITQNLLFILCINPEPIYNFFHFYKILFKTECLHFFWYFRWTFCCCSERKETGCKNWYSWRSQWITDGLQWSSNDSCLSRTWGGFTKFSQNSRKSRFCRPSKGKYLVTLFHEFTNSRFFCFEWSGGFTNILSLWIYEIECFWFS